MMRIVMLAFSLTMVGCKPAVAPRPLPKTPATFDPYPAPAFSLTERSGKTLTKDELKGSIWIAAFVFTRCNGPCPSISATMAKLQGELLPNRPDVKLITFTVDPDRDTPDELKKYAANFRADPDRWLFLTGEEDVVRKLLMEGFKINATKKHNPQPGDEFDHNTKLMVIDREGQIRGLFDGMKRTWDQDGSLFAEDLARLTNLVDSLRK